ncbi:MAG: hypothetical protein CMJ64_03485 [Planctomycetaceae bacterium]|nr:hypothetical protein [Planctomycetaceae bacterium]
MCETLVGWINSPTVKLKEVSFDPATREDLERPEELVGRQLANYRIEAFLGQGGCLASISQDT